MGYLDKRAVRRGRKPESSAQGPGGPERAGPGLPGVQESVAKAERKRLSWSQGKDEQVGATSLGILTRYGWTGLHGVRWAGVEDETISHVAIGPGGVVVVDEKDWTGNVTVEGGVLRHGGYRCEGDLERLITACATVTSLLAPEYRSAVVGVLCVTTRDMPAEPTGGVYVVGRLHLASLLVDLEPRLSPLDVADITRELTARLLGIKSVSAAAATPRPRVVPPTPALASEPSGYFVPRPNPGSPHDPAAAHAPATTSPGPDRPIPVPAQAVPAGPVVRVATPGWPGDELVTRPTLPQQRVPVTVPVVACWPGDEGPDAARPEPARTTTPGWPSATEPEEDWTGVPSGGAVPSAGAVPMAQPTTPGWPGRPAVPLVMPGPLEIPATPAQSTGWSTTRQAATPRWPARPAAPARWGSAANPAPAHPNLRGVVVIGLEESVTNSCAPSKVD